MEVHENPGVLLGGSLAEWTTLTTPQKFNSSPLRSYLPDRKGLSPFPAIFSGANFVKLRVRKKNMVSTGNSLASSPAARYVTFTGQDMWQGSTPPWGITRYEAAVPNRRISDVNCGNLYSPENGELPSLKFIFSHLKIGLLPQKDMSSSNHPCSMFRCFCS